MTLMRPYLLLFLLLPMYFWIKKSRWRGAVGSAFVLFLTVGLYAGIKHYLGAEYFAPLFFTDWISAFFERGLFGGLRFTLGKLYRMGISFLRYVLESFRSGLAAGAFFSGYLVTFFILLYQSLADFLKCQREKRENKFLVIEAHLLFSFAAMLIAVLLMY